MAMRFVIVIKTGPEQGKEIILDQPEVSIGRDSHNDIIINDPEVSRFHAVLNLQDIGYVIEDKGSTNGTFINNQRLMGPHALTSGEIVFLGENISFEFTAVDSEATVVKTSRKMPEKVHMDSLPPLPSSSEPKHVAVPEPVAASAALPGAKKKRRTWLIVLLILVIGILLLCVIPIWLIDMTNSWCSLFGNILHNINPAVCIPIP